ncbi:MAG: hypothetical protein SV775_16545 [Thermodesulfobacteriota bacterium]|nr:hypothetical protein [Thermodesulfobacteriota bacterium]
MDEYEEELAFERKMDHITEHIEEMVLDAMLSALIKIKERNIDFLKSESKSNHEPFPF